VAFWSRHDKLEDRLRAERPRPSDDLISSIKSDLSDAKRAPRRGLRPQLRLAGITAALFAGLLVIGGAGYAMTSIGGLIDSVSTHIGIRTTVRTVVLNAANDQYSTTTAATTTTQTTTQTTTSATTTTTAVGGGQQVKTEAPANTAGTLTLSLPGAGASSVGVTWAAASFGGKKVTATATAVKGDTVGQSQGSSTQQVVAITVTDPATGQPIHQLAAPLMIVFRNTAASYVPALSEDGVNFRQLSLLAHATLPDGQQDGYWRSGATVIIFTRHLTSFAVLYKANLAQSESGRKTAPAGSGKFGDPTRIHTGAPVVKAPASATASGSDVGVSFFVDEQAAVYVHVLSGSNQLVLGNSSTIRKHKIGGKSRKTFHLVILRPGTINLNLHVPGVKPGAKVQLTFVDFDGHKVSKTVTVK
jgi:hypothetical protein